MVARFEVGKKYECCDSGISPVEIIKRTKKTCMVRNDIGTVWRMLIRVYKDSEFMTDSKVEKKWQGIYTYYAKFKVVE